MAERNRIEALKCKLFSRSIVIRKRDVEQYRAQIQTYNASALSMLCCIGAGVSLVLVVLSLPFVGVLSLLPSYAALFLFMAGILLVHTLSKRKHPKLSLPLYYILILALDCIAIYMGTVQGITTNATTFLLFILLFPLFIIDRPWRTNLISGCIVAGFISAAFYFKPAGDIRALDISNALIVYLLSIILVNATVRRNLSVFGLQQKAADELHRKNDLINNLPVGVAIFKAHDGAVNQTFINDEFLHLFEDTRENRAERPDRSFMEQIHPNDRAKIAEAIKSVLDGRDFITCPCRARKGDGTYLWVRFSSKVAVRNGNDLLVYSTYASMEDEMKSKEAAQAKSEFLSRMSHDMRTPLNAILGFLEIAQEERTSPEILDDSLTKIESSGKYLLGLINDILDMSKIESGKYEIHAEIVDSLACLQSIAALFSAQAAQKGISLVTDFSRATTPWLYMDQLRTRQICSNLLNNAIKFSDSGTTVTWTIVDTPLSEHRISRVCTVADQGCGMSEAFMTRIFKPFEQETNEHSPETPGTGIGLSIAKSLVELMGGTITAESELGKGSTFTVRMDFETASLPPRETAAAEEADETMLAGRRVLVCEDHPLNREIAVRLLEKKGMLVEVAVNGRAGVDAFLQSECGHFDAILMDLRMPILTGIEATKLIRASDRSDAKTVPVIAMTANAFEDDVHACLAAGMNAHLPKPIDTKNLYQELAKQLQPAVQKQNQPGS